MINLQDNKNKKGFSMGEVLLSVFILGVTMVTVLQLFVVSLKNFADTQDSVIASMLAQEGIELVKNIRDNNWVSGSNTYNNINATGMSSCALDVDDVSCSSNSDNNVDCRFDHTADTNCSLYFNEDNGKYTRLMPGGKKTKFKRGIKILAIGNLRIIISKVNWNPQKKIPSLAECNIANKCVFSISTLTTWGE